MTAYLYQGVYITLILYVIATGCYFMARKNEKMAQIAFALSVAGMITNFLSLIARAMLVERLPLANGAEFLLNFSWFTVLMYLFYEIKSKNRNAGGIVMLIAACLVGAILILVPDQLGNTTALMPALQSPWLTSHVLTAVFAYGGFALAAGLAAVQLRKSSATKVDGWIYRIVALSFAMLTLTIVLGAIWAEQAWGQYWSWDPKETWALITWIFYAIYLHLHQRRGWRGQKSNLLVVAGFIFVLFTYFGVNYLLSGLHSYG